MSKLPAKDRPQKYWYRCSEEILGDHRSLADGVMLAEAISVATKPLVLPSVWGWFRRAPVCFTCSNRFVSQK